MKPHPLQSSIDYQLAYLTAGIKPPITKIEQFKLLEKLAEEALLKWDTCNPSETMHTDKTIGE